MTTQNDFILINMPHIHSHVHGDGKLIKLTITNQVPPETSYKLAAEKATALSWSDPNLMMINPHQTMTIKKKHIAAVQFSNNCAYIIN